MSNVDDEIMEDIWQTNTSKLTSAISSLPELITRKKLLDMHTDLASKLMEIVKSSKIDRLTELESKIISKSLKDNYEIFEIVESEDIPMFDRFRVVAIALLCDCLSKSDLARLQPFLDSTDYVPVIDYLIDYKNVTKITNQQQSSSASNTYSHMFSKIVAKSPSILQGVKSLMMWDKGYFLTQIVQSLLETGTTDLLDLSTLDPRQTVDGSYKSTISFDEIVVFVVGGGCYTEYQDLMSIINKKHLAGKNIIYGCTEMMNATYFTEQLRNLGKS
ncbi:Sec1 family domain-containing protein 1 [Thelohanellus kitauei]|uniref:Sec1 family domain-containing protein 1 n=1 Tax=Thelohanellus kitauei TaxID=669202 RepID=A0A0C2MK01_THEKT|nr:Sec1 family domain-containing protein 1 [Thelohanellus kitauei]